MTRRAQTTALYILTGASAALALLLVNYATLRLTSSIGVLYAQLSPISFMLYVGLTTLTVTVFGWQIAFLVYQFRRYGLRNLLSQSGTGIGAVLGIVGSSCPICGTTVLSLLGVAGSLASLPFQGVELKAVAFVLVLISALFSKWWLQTRCSGPACPVALDDSLKTKEQSLLVSLALVMVLLLILLAQLFLTDSIRFPELQSAAYSCQLEGSVQRWF